MSDELLSALHHDLVLAGYTADRLTEAWGAVAQAALDRGDAVPASLALAAAARTPLTVLGRLFALGETVDAAAVDAALPGVGVAGSAALGLVVQEAGGIRAAVSLEPVAVTDEDGVASWWVVADRPADGELPEDHVLGVSPASGTLANLLVPTSGSVLDLGTGSGIQALHAARTASRVVATDVSPRALGHARRTAVLNDVAIDLRLGSLYAPVAGERFDRVVSNPPFVITPRQAERVPAYVYRDGGMAGDGLVAAVVRGAADVLRDGGIAQLLGNWEVHGDPQAARERVLGWAGGLDVWVVERDVVDPAQYAETWVRDGGVTRGGDRWRDLVRAWLRDFDERGVTAVAAGYITLRRPPIGGPTLRRYERVDGRIGASAGRSIAAAFAAHDLLRGLDDVALGQRHLRTAPDVTERRHYWPGDPDPTVIELVQGGGFARVRRVDTVTAAVVGACDGQLPVGTIADAVARLLDADRVETRAAVLPVVRELLFDGFLQPDG